MTHHSSARNAPNLLPWQRYPTMSIDVPKHAIVIGAGIAGATTAFCLAEKGWQVTVIERHAQSAKEGSGNVQGILYTKLSSHATLPYQLLLAGLTYTLGLLPKYLEHHFWQQCGILQLARSPQEQQRQQQLISTYPNPDYYHLVTHNAAEKLAGLAVHHGGLFFPQSGWLHPPALVNNLLQHPLINCQFDQYVTNIVHLPNQHWAVYDAYHHCLATAPVVVIANAYQATQFSQLAHLSLIAVSGQTTVTTATDSSNPLSCVITGDGYISPVWQGKHCYGATAHINQSIAKLTLQDHHDNLTKIDSLSPVFKIAFTKQYQYPHQLLGHAAIRCTSLDRLPLVGPIIDELIFRKDYARLAIDKHSSFDTPCSWLPGLYVNLAHGTRGLITAPLSGKILANMITGIEKEDITSDIIIGLNPNRFLVREMIRGK